MRRAEHVELEAVSNGVSRSIANRRQPTNWRGLRKQGSLFTSQVPRLGFQQSP